MSVLSELLGESPGVVAVREQLERLLRHESTRRLPPILIEGETGTGKGLLAREIHRAGPRRQGAFVEVNCAAIPETLLESEMFGVEAGAYTDARKAKVGLLQAAHRGMIFLDEVGLLPYVLQAKLLKAIEEQAVRRLGSTRSEPVDVWIVAATSADLVGAMRAQKFRADLYHRLAVLTVRLPPLRERGQDIVRLAEHFLARICADYRLPRQKLDPGARAALLAYGWPGNVRELANVLERALLLSEGSVITAEMLALGEPRQAEAHPSPPPATSTSLEDEVTSVERVRIVDALDRVNWNVSRAAELLNISRNKLRYRIQTLGLRPDASARAPQRKRTPRTNPVPTPPVATDSPGTSPLRWERRRLTVLRADIVNPQGAQFRLDTTRLVELAVEKLRGFGGRIEELSPTTIVAIFGLDPVEDAPRRAALSAMALLKAGEGFRDGGVEFALNIGIHVDRLSAARMGTSLLIERDGKREAWATLEALVTRGEKNTIVVSPAAVPFLERRFGLVPVSASDEVAVKAYRLVGREHEGPGFRGRFARLVGRSAELELLRDRLRAVVAGQGQVVGIVGDPGIGKSHLLYEFCQSLAERDVTYLEGRCFSYATPIPYFPVLEILRGSFGIEEADTPAALVDKVRRGLEQIGMAARESAPYIVRLLGIEELTDRLDALSPEAIKARTFEVLSELTVRGSLYRPLVLAVEDLHWIDTASEAYLATLLEQLAGVPLLLLLTYRPGYRPPAAERSYFTQIALQPLSAEDSLKVVQGVLETDRIAEPVARVILDKADGNPFFLEELARVVGDAPDHLPQAVPETLEDVLLARIDRTPEDHRRLLQTASVLGREFPIRLLRELSDVPGDLDAQLRDLTRLEFLTLRSATQEPLCVFRHALMQQVAYESCPLSRCQTLHARAGRVMETLYADRLDEFTDTLAHHYSKTTHAEKAVEYLFLLATKAVRASAHVEALTALEQALPHLECLPDRAERERRRFSVLLLQAHSLTFLGRFNDMLELLNGDRDRVEHLQDPAMTGPYYFWLGRTYSVLGDHDRAVENAQRALADATRCGDAATMGKACYTLAYEDYWSGRARAGVERGGQGVALLSETQERLWLGLAHWVVAINYAHLGEYAAALEAAAQVQAIGEVTGDPTLSCTAAWTRGMICAARGDHATGIAACRRALETSPNPVNTALAMGVLGGSYLERGDAAAALPFLQEAVQQLAHFRVPTQGLFSALLGEAHLGIGQLERAFTLAEEGARQCRGVGYPYGLSWGLRALGRIALAQGTLSDAATYLAEALQTFNAIEARAEEGRTHLILAELARARNHRAGAASHLAEAVRLCDALALSTYRDRAEALAREWGVHPIRT